MVATQPPTPEISTPATVAAQIALWVVSSVKTGSTSQIASGNSGKKPSVVWPW